MTDRAEQSSDAAGEEPVGDGHEVPADLVVLHEVLEWERAIGERS